MLSLTPQTIEALPERTAVSADSGRAHARLWKESGVIYVSASCDSLERLVSLYEEQLSQMTVDNTVRNVPRQRTIKIFAAGMVCGLLLMFTLRRRRY